ncbi:MULTISPECIES: hypothetical protein [unclassified Bradyrhizobium]
MAQRVIINANGTFRVSVPGVDAGGAQFDNLIFDSNQPPLRISQNGWFTMTPILDSDYTAPSPQNVKEQAGASVVVTDPGGASPLFMTMHRAPAWYGVSDGGSGVVPVFDNGILMTPTRSDSTTNLNVQGYKGSGGAICSNVFLGVTFTPQTFDPLIHTNHFDTIYINYAIFKNFT